jgi:hypothetical protein
VASVAQKVKDAHQKAVASVVRLKAKAAPKVALLELVVLKDVAPKVALPVRAVPKVAALKAVLPALVARAAECQACAA